MLKESYVTLLSLITAALMQADPVSPLTLSGEGPVEVKWNGIPILAVEELGALENGFEDYDGYTRQQVGEWEVQNLWRVQDVNKEASFRREIAQKGNEAELTIQYRIPAYYFDTRPDKLHGFYRVRIPMKSVRGMKFKARVHSGGTATRVVRGVFGEGPIQGITGTRIVYLTLEDKQGNVISLDFAPAGQAVFNGNVGASRLPRSWWWSMNEEEIRFSIGRIKETTYPYNGVHLGKIRISEDRFEDWEQRHPHHRYRYFMELYPLRQFALGAGQLQEGWLKGNNKEITELEWLQRRGRRDLWLPVGKELFSEWSGYGWENPNAIELKGNLQKGVLHGWATSEEEGLFRVNVPEPGVYVFTVRVGHVDSNVGPFTLAANGEVAVANLQVPEGEIREITFSRYIEGKQTELRFSGDWAVSTIAIQPLLAQTEDFAFQRGLWIAEDIPTPTTLYQFDRRAVPLEAAIQGYPVAYSGARQPLERIALTLPENDPATEWRWESAINALGPGNNGSFYEFETEELINRRLDELEASGFRTILLNGMLIRHAFPEEHERVKQTVGLIAKLAHERGMKVVDHFDLTIVPNMSAAYQQFVENIEWAQKDVRSGQVTRGYCINNPHFLRYFIDKMVDYVKETNMDGLMLDEVTFHGPSYCGCEHCRNKFYQDTGLTLPVDETSPDLLNTDSRLWKQWLFWRYNNQPDFCVAVLEAIREIRPDFVWMKYGAPIVFTTARGSSRQDEGIRFSSFMGIETISPNIHVTHRFNLVSASIYSSLVDPFNIPKFVLIYPMHQTVSAYAGWIMGNMSGYSLWLIQGNEEIEEDSKRYLDWKENMDIRRVRPVADVGVLYSLSSRDFSQDTKRYEEETVGLLQQLDDLHIAHQVLLDRDATMETLNRYSLMVVPGASAISDEHLQLLHDYIREGGKVLFTGYTATEDEFGIARNSWPLERWLQVSLQGELEEGYNLEGELVSKGRTRMEGSALQVVQAKGVDVQGVVARLKQGDKSSLGIIARNLGSGSLVWVVPGIGAANYEADGRVGQNWNFRENREAFQVLERLLTSALGDRPAFRAVEMPEAVKVRVYRGRPEVEKGTTYVHLYNATGAVVREQGKPFPARPPSVAFPALKSDLVFDLTLEEGQYQAKLVSPDFEKHWPLQIERVDEGAYRVTVPSQALHAYAIVRILPVENLEEAIP